MANPRQGDKRKDERLSIIQLNVNPLRNLNITSVGKNFLNIRKKIISIIKKLNWKDGFYRKDIGWKVINKNANN